MVRKRKTLFDFRQFFERKHIYRAEIFEFFAQIVRLRLMRFSKSKSSCEFRTFQPIRQAINSNPRAFFIQILQSRDGFRLPDFERGAFVSGFGGAFVEFGKFVRFLVGFLTRAISERRSLLEFVLFARLFVFGGCDLVFRSAESSPRFFNF